jgi:DNA replication and repair protein RecF
VYFSRLQLTQFRNYRALDMRFGKGINCISGVNGAGKSNILDALHYLALTRGFRSSQDRQAVQEGEGFFLIEGTVDHEGITQDVQCNYLPGKGKKLLVNRQPLTKMSDHIGNIPLVSIMPNDTELISGSASVRRRFLDMLISQYDHSYLVNLIQYDRILSQRNALLKFFMEHRTFDQEELELWNAQLVPYGISLLRDRRQYLKEYLPIFREFFKKIVSRKETPDVTYETQVEDNTIDGWLAMLRDKQEKDRILQYTSSGIHRDDLDFSINGISARNFGSQGQQKTFVAALKLAQYRLLEQHKRMAPILLLDDIFDKLDVHRLNSIANILDREIDGQVFVTNTSHDQLEEIFRNPINSETTFFHVEDGKMSRISDLAE